MNLRSFYAQNVTPAARRIPRGERLNKAMIAFFADLQEPSAETVWQTIKSGI